MKDRVILVHLRRPRLNDPNDTRRDPFWEFGSFGLTGCHERNIMHPKRICEVEGCRFAFAQGGKAGTRLVYLSPPVKLVAHQNVVEARWQPSLPFRYEDAPLLINMEGETNFPKLKEAIRNTKGSAWTSKFSSRYRSSRMPLAQSVASEIIRKFDQVYSNANGSLIQTYEEALPFLPRKVDENRRKTYQALLSNAKV